jgi:hypothetical protein
LCSLKTTSRFLLPLIEQRGVFQIPKTILAYGIIKILLHERSFTNKQARVRLTDCHDWTWSKSLWKQNAKLITYIVILNVVVYFALAYWTTAYDGFTGIDNMYLITATLTTVENICL